MKLTFVGDISFPCGRGIAQPPTFEGLLIPNLEGPIVDESLAMEVLSHDALFNCESVIDHLRQWRVPAVVLANNHLYDLGEAQVLKTFDLLQRSGIRFAGGGTNASHASRSVAIDCGGAEVELLAFGWQAIGCRPARRSTSGVNALTLANVDRQVRVAKASRPGVKVVVFMHWNYELELAPQPAHRQIARRAIDAGADVVVGCHSHIAEPIEVYKDRPIAYGLGNWLIPSGYFQRGRLIYPAISRRQLALSWDPESGAYSSSLFEMNQGEFVTSPDEASAELLMLGKSFEHMSDREYVAWFRQQRRKKAFLPIYREAESLATPILDGWLRLRTLFIDLLARAGLKSGRR